MYILRTIRSSAAQANKVHALLGRTLVATIGLILSLVALQPTLVFAASLVDGTSANTPQDNQAKVQTPPADAATNETNATVLTPAPQTVQTNETHNSTTSIKAFSGYNQFDDLGWMDSKQLAMSDFLYQQAINVNNLFGSYSTDLPDLTLRVSTLLGYDSFDNQLTPRLSARAKVQLPNANKRFKLYFSSDVDNPYTTNPTADGSEQTTNSKQLRQNSNLGIQYNWLERMGVRSSFRIGVNSDPELYAKINVGRNWRLSNTNNLNWYNELRAGSNTNLSSYSQLNISHRVNDKLLLAYTPQAIWRAQQAGYTTNQTASLSYSLSDKQLLKTGYSMQHICTSSDCQIDSRVGWITHQTPLYRPWIVLETSLGVRQSSSLNQVGGGYAQVQLHTYFGRNYK